MTIFEFIESINNDDIVFTIFNCDTEELVSMRLDDGSFTTEFNRDDLLYGDYGDISIGGTDMWVESNGRIHIEFNVDIDEDEYGWEEE
jgi:hypothetical protein